MTLQEYLDSIHGKTVAVVGIGVSNTPLIRLLLREGIAVTACDKRTREQLGELAGELEQGGARLQLGSDYLEGLDQDIIFRTPGLRPDVPQLAKTVAGGSVLTSEMEVFFQVCPCPIIAVTGSDGKTTTTTIIAELLKKAGRTVHVGGNIGHPLLCEAGEMQPTDYAVLELSSFQLMTMPCSPHIAVLTNLAPNHLDVHKDMAEYVAAKENIFRHQKPGDKAIFNFDNDITRRQGESVPDRAVYFSRQAEPEKGVFLRGDAIVCRDGRGERTVMTTGDIKLPGVHNVENYMAAIAAVDSCMEGKMLVGAGTVLALEQLDMARDAGANYIITPNTNCDLIRRVKEYGLLSFPGAFTPSEIVEAYEAGADAVKVFPVGNLGPSYIKAIKAPLSHIPLMAVGGVNEKNAAGFLAAGCCGIGVGGNLVNKSWIEAGEWDKITELAQAYRKAVDEA